ncbi:hypothetical protein PUN4_150060 [Paraburkholderia unamae]|nr:hypothetical protein PUN4_150060 [Paraburkholderia unamae]
MDERPAPEPRTVSAATQVVSSPNSEGLLPQWHLADWVVIAVAPLGAFALGPLVLD